MKRALAVVALLTATAGAAFLGAYAGHGDAPPPADVTVASPWADGCTTDADCAAMDEYLTSIGWVYAGDESPATYTEPSDWGDTGGEGDDLTANAWTAPACSGVDREPVLPCRLPDDAIGSLPDADGVVHEHCTLLEVTVEDSLVVCADGWTEES